MTYGLTISRACHVDACKSDQPPLRCSLRPFYPLESRTCESTSIFYQIIMHFPFAQTPPNDFYTQAFLTYLHSLVITLEFIIYILIKMTILWSIKRIIYFFFYLAFSFLILYYLIGFFSFFISF